MPCPTPRPGAEVVPQPGGEGDVPAERDHLGQPVSAAGQRGLRPGELLPVEIFPSGPGSVSPLS